MHPKVEIADTVCGAIHVFFTEKKGRFSTATVKRDGRNPEVNMLQWWKFHGGDTKELRDVEFEVLTQRNHQWFIHNRKQNKLNVDFADDDLISFCIFA